MHISMQKNIFTHGQHGTLPRAADHETNHYSCRELLKMLSGWIEKGDCFIRASYNIIMLVQLMNF